MPRSAADHVEDGRDGDDRPAQVEAEQQDRGDEHGHRGDAPGRTRHGSGSGARGSHVCPCSPGAGRSRTPVVTGPTVRPDRGRVRCRAGAAGETGTASGTVPPEGTDGRPRARPRHQRVRGRPGPPRRLRRPALLRPDRRHPHRRARRPRRAHRLVADPRPRLLPHLRRDPRRARTAAGSSWPRSSRPGPRGATCRARTSWRPRTSPRPGTVRVVDALNTGGAGRLPWTELARRVEGVAGRVADALRGRARDVPELGVAVGARHRARHRPARPRRDAGRAAARRGRDRGHRPGRARRRSAPRPGHATSSA